MNPVSEMNVDSVVTDSALRGVHHLRVGLGPGEEREVRHPARPRQPLVADGYHVARPAVIKTLNRFEVAEYLPHHLRAVRPAAVFALEIHVRGSTRGARHLRHEIDAIHPRALDSLLVREGRADPRESLLDDVLRSDGHLTLIICE